MADGKRCGPLDRVGGGCGDGGRARRAAPDAVGCMPWTAVFMAALLVAVVTGALAVLTWMSP